MTGRLESKDPVQQKSALQQEWDNVVLCVYGRSPEEIREKIEGVRAEKGDEYAKVVAHEIAASRRF